MSSNSFYSKVPVIENFFDIASGEKYVPVPSDWHVIITDVKNSTKEIEAGRYKEVNMVGASSIIALLNVAKDTDIPFVFGGDGASALMPGELLRPATHVLLATQELAKKDFNMDLRVGIVPVKVLYQSGYALNIARFKVDENYTQAVFSGGGLQRAEALVKDPATGGMYQLKKESEHPTADFSGLECRWQDVKSSRGETVSILIKAVSGDAVKEAGTYREVLQKIDEIYGTAEQHHPVTFNQLNLTIQAPVLDLEAKFHESGKGLFAEIFYLSKILLQNFFISLFLNLKITTPIQNYWGMYKNILIATTDYRKFDDVLRMVISGGSSERASLSSYLEEKYKQGMLVYGIHVSDRAVMTCLVFERMGKQVHFVDGADGGYALAAKALKEQASALGKSKK